MCWLGKSRRWPGDFKRILRCSRGPGPELGLWGFVPALTPCQIREKLSPPINFSVSFSHPCCERSGGLGWDQQQLPLYLPSSNLHKDNLPWVGGGSQSPGQRHNEDAIENNTHSALSWISQARCHGDGALLYPISFTLTRTLHSGFQCYDAYFIGE